MREKTEKRRLFAFSHATFLTFALLLMRQQQQLKKRAPLLIVFKHLKLLCVLRDCWWQYIWQRQERKKQLASHNSLWLARVMTNGEKTPSKQTISSRLIAINALLFMNQSAHYKLFVGFVCFQSFCLLGVRIKCSSWWWQKWMMGKRKKTQPIKAHYVIK